MKINMEARELMIGNLVCYNDDSLHCKIIGIHEYGLDVETDEETFYTEYERFSPIPLTEEILLKCGFERASEYGLQAFWINEDWGIYYCSFSKGTRFIDRGWIADMPHLHQLQNLYFALTGKELDISL